jgi:hypothetical protein
MTLRIFRVVPMWSEGGGMLESAPVDCLSCGEPFTLSVDTTGGRDQRYVEDCPVCCRPMEIRVTCRDGDVISVETGAA